MRTSPPRPLEMDPQQHLESLCRRHGLAPRQAEPLLPLVQLAWTARPAVRRRILGWVESALERRSDPVATPATATETPAEQELLALVAGVLHRWHPGSW